MPCVDVMELETIWQKQFDRATSAANGLFTVAVSHNPQAAQALIVRQLRAKQALAAQAILVHRSQCSQCNSREAEPFIWSDALWSDALWSDALAS